MEPYEAIATYYDLEHDGFEDDIDLYSQMFFEGPLLEVGAGTGRIAVPLARQGLEVWGVDPSEAMLARARERSSGDTRVHLVRADVRNLSLGQRFRAVVFPLNTLWHLPGLEAQLDGLRSVAGHMHAGGLLVIDTSNPHAMDDRGSLGTMRVRFTRTHEDERVTGYSAAWDDEAEQVLTLELWYDAQRADGAILRSSGRLELRYLYRGELELLLRLAGFRLEHVYGSYDLAEYETSSPRLLVTARLDEATARSERRLDPR